MQSVYSIAPADWTIIHLYTVKWFHALLYMSIIQIRHTVKEFQVLLFNTNNSILLIRLHTVTWFQVLLCVKNNSIKLFVCTRFKCQKVLFDSQMGPYQVLYRWRCPWCNGYRRWKWTRRHEFKSWTRLIAFHIALIPLAKVWIQLISLQLWVNSRTDWVLQPWWGN